MEKNEGIQIGLNCEYDWRNKMGLGLLRKLNAIVTGCLGAC